MAEICSGCKKSFRNLRNHLAQSNRCPAALEYQAKPPEPEPITEGQSETLVEKHSEPQTAGITETDVRTLLAEAIGEAVTQVSKAVNERLEAERQTTQRQFEQVGPAVLTYLKEQAAKEREQAQAQQTAPPAGEQAAPQGGDGLTQLANILSMFTKSSGGGLEQIAETIGSIGKLADAMDSLRYRPWRDGVDFATQNILQRTRMPGGPTPEGAAEDLQKSMQGPSVYGRPILPAEGKP